MGPIANARYDRWRTTPPLPMEPRRGLPGGGPCPSNPAGAILGMPVLTKLGIAIAAGGRPWRPTALPWPRPPPMERNRTPFRGGGHGLANRRLRKGNAPPSPPSWRDRGGHDGPPRRGAGHLDSTGGERSSPPPPRTPPSCGRRRRAAWCSNGRSGRGPSPSYHRPSPDSGHPSPTLPRREPWRTHAPEWDNAAVTRP